VTAKMLILTEKRVNLTSLPSGWLCPIQDVVVFIVAHAGNHADI